MAVNFILSQPLTGQSIAFDPPITGPYEAVSGQFFIRTYLDYIETVSNPWATSLGAAELQRRSGRTFEILNGAFNQFGIYFVAASGQEESCYSIETDQPTHSNGLTIQILSDDGGIDGSAGTPTLPSISCFVKGNEDGVPASNLAGAVAHEVGHCLGLAHTHQPSLTDFCVNNSCVGDPNKDPDFCCGDLVSDTEAHSNNNITLSSECCCPSPVVSEATYRNIMSYSNPVRCRQILSPEQGLRMRWFLANASSLAPLLISPEIISANTSVTWNTPQAKSANIEVESGAVLTINAEITMMSGTYIIVRRGGTLVINNNGIVTAECGLWGGVIVEGKADEVQELPYQGKVVLNGTIEHALRGIGAHGLDETEPNFAGGIVEAKGIIRNCVTGIQFNRYRRSAGGEPIQNKSYLYLCRFFLDDDFRGDASVKPVCLRLNDITQLRIQLSHFRDERTQGCAGRASRADGIVSEEASFKVYSGCYFLNLDRAVRASVLSLDNGGYEVRNSTFHDCYTSIESSLFDAFTIRDNNFQIKRPEMCPFVQTEPIVGTYLASHAEGMLYAENTFTGVDNNGDDTYIGTECIGLGTMENEIRQNDYSDLDYANRAAGGNGGSEGLMYVCNTQTDNTYDIYVRSNGTVRAVQGAIDGQTGARIAAGNTFSLTADVGFDNREGDQVVTYYWNDDVQAENPDFYGEEPPTLFAKLADLPNSDCGTDVEGCPTCPEGELDALKQQFFQQRGAWQSKKALYPTLSDEQARQALQQEINAHRSVMDKTGAQVLRNYLLDSTSVRPDSALVWLAHLRRYEADLRIARHHFFKGNYTAAAQWIDDIPSRNELSIAQNDELADMAQVLAVMQPHLSGGTALHQLPGTALDSLRYWASDCSESGFVAKEVLRRNGIETSTECGGEPEGRPLDNTSKAKPPSQVVGDIRVYPNPARDLIFVEMLESQGELRIVISSSVGRIVFERVINGTQTLSVAHLPSGFYMIKAVSATGGELTQKLIISH